MKEKAYPGSDVCRVVVENIDKTAIRVIRHKSKDILIQIEDGGELTSEGVTMYCAGDDGRKSVTIYRGDSRPGKGLEVTIRVPRGFKKNENRKTFILERK